MAYAVRKPTRPDADVDMGRLRLSLKQDRQIIVKERRTSWSPDDYTGMYASFDDEIGLHLQQQPLASPFQLLPTAGLGNAIMPMAKAGYSVVELLTRELHLHRYTGMQNDVGLMDPLRGWVGTRSTWESGIMLVGSKDQGISDECNPCRCEGSYY